MLGSVVTEPHCEQVCCGVGGWGVQGPYAGPYFSSYY